MMAMTQITLCTELSLTHELPERKGRCPRFRIRSPKPGAYVTRFSDCINGFGIARTGMVSLQF